MVLVSETFESTSHEPHLSILASGLAILAITVHSSGTSHFKSTPAGLVNMRTCYIDRRLGPET